MKERPVIFNGEMVRAILDGSKLQTRRVITDKLRNGEDLNDIGGAARTLRKCPYGHPGDRLWVRETWSIDPQINDNAQLIYRADLFARWFDDAPVGDGFYLPSDYQPKRWRPSIHMPRWASRITLEVTGVSVARVQEIAAADAAAEGVVVSNYNAQLGADHLDVFAELWDNVNAKSGYGWAVNPWVWVVEFRRIGQ